MKKTQILVEGPDCSGKSTLVERLKNELRWDAKSLHHNEGNQFRRYLREYALQEQIVFDRGHFSEIVYSCLWRGRNPFLTKEQEILNEICKQNMIVIFANPSLETLQERYKKRTFPQQIKYEELGIAQKYFCEVMNKSPYHLYQSTSYAELQSLLEKIICEVQ